MKVGEGELAEGVRAFLDDRFDSLALHAFVDSGELRSSVLQQGVDELGLSLLAIPERLGGLDIGKADLVSIQAVVGAYMPPISLFATALATSVLEQVGGDTWLERIVAGETAAVSLPPHGALSLIERTNDGVLVSGEVDFLIDGVTADFWLLRASDAWFVCANDVSGSSVMTQSLVDETRHAARVTLDRVRIPSDNLLVTGADCDAIDRRLLSNAALALAADSVGGMGAILGKTLEYMCVREQFSRPIGSFQALKHRAANLHLRLATAQAMLEEAVSAAEGALADADDLALLACAQASDAYAFVAQDALQLHGGIGFTRAHDAHIYLKRAKLNQALLGGASALRDRAAAGCHRGG